MNLFEQRSFDRHSVIQPSMRGSRLLEVINNIDSADEGQPPIDHREFAMHSAQAVRAEFNEPLPRPKHKHPGARISQMRNRRTT